MSTKNSVQVIELDGVEIRVDAYGRYCLNDMHKAAVANKVATDSQAPAQFIRNDGVQAFIAALDAENLGDVQIRTSVHSVKGGKSQGTYADELVAIRYAAWIDPSFEVRVYRTFQKKAKEKRDWTRLRSAAASTYKVMSSILQMVHEADGKEAKNYHYINEALLVNWALSGEFKGLKRDEMPIEDLSLLAHLEERNAVMIGRGFDYTRRKPLLLECAKTWRMSRTPLLEAQ